MPRLSAFPSRPLQRTQRCAAAVAFAVALIATPPAVAASSGGSNPGFGGSNANSLKIETLSTVPYLVSGGDVLVRVSVPSNMSMNSVRVTLNGSDVTYKFTSDSRARSMTGLVNGLARGNNTIAASSRNSKNGGGSLTVTNYPITGPMISGPHEEPFICQTAQFSLPTTGGNLGQPIDADCSIYTRYDWVYWSTGNASATPPVAAAFKPLNTANPVPSDVAMTMVNGRNIRFIVRVETGTINRAIYQIAMLHDPYSEGTPTWQRHTLGWNGKLIYQHGGGCQGGWFIQGASTGGVLTMSHLAKGYARASASLNVFGNNCNDLLASETTIMVKEHFIEAYGVPTFTIGTGSSGGSYQSNQTSDNYPGIFDGIVTMNNFPDVTTGMVTLHDSRIFDTLFNTTLPGMFNDDKQKAITGWRQVAETVFLSRDPGTSALRMDPTAVFDASVPVNFRYDPVNNPDGARGTPYDHTINVYGEDSRGFSRRPMDNVGVQYGLLAVNNGQISVDEFLTVNEKIGGVDIDFKPQPQRTMADRAALHRAYISGRILNTGNGLHDIPMIQQHGVNDPTVTGGIHLKFYSYALRQRLINQNGHADNQVIVAPFNNPNPDSLFDQMDRWLTAIQADQTDRPQWRKVVANKPADAVDACWDASGNKIVEVHPSADPYDQAFGTSPCNTLDQSSMTPNLAAGAPIDSTIIKCQLKPINPTDYKVTFSTAQMARLRSIFPDGVCDWSKPGVEQTDNSVTWASFGPSRKNLVFDINNPNGK